MNEEQDSQDELEIDDSALEMAAGGLINATSTHSSNYTANQTIHFQ